MPSGAGGGPSFAPMPFQPPNQGAAAQGFGNLALPMAAQGGANLAGFGQYGTPSQLAYPPAITAAFNTINNPYQNQALDAASGAASTFMGGVPNMLGASNMAYGAMPNVMAAANNPAYAQAGAMGGMAAPQLMSAGSSILNQAFDPQNALRQRMQSQVLDQSTVANAIAGLGSSPYGASTTANALGNFDINWQNQQLQRMAQGAGAAAPAFTSAISDILQPANNAVAAQLEGSQALGQLGNLGANQLTGAASGMNTFGTLPYGAYNTIQGTDLGAMSNLQSLGNVGYNLPEQAIGNFTQYMQLGGNAAQNAANAASVNNQIGSTNFNQLAGGLGGLSNLAFGSQGLAGLGSGGLFGGGGGLFGGGLDAGTAATGGLFDSPATLAAPLAFS